MTYEITNNQNNNNNKKQTHLNKCKNKEFPLIEQVFFCLFVYLMSVTNNHFFFENDKTRI